MQLFFSQFFSIPPKPRKQQPIGASKEILTEDKTRVVKSLRGTSRFLAEDVAEHDLDRLVNKPVF